jgi:DNA-binding response OmpR family regulator
MDTLLLVDDDNTLRKLTADYLERNGFAVVHAHDGATALSRLRSSASSNIAAVLLDVMMPGMDGLSVLAQLRTFSQVPVLMLTAKGDETDRIVGLEVGADDYLPKPFAPRELLARLRAVLRRTSPKATGAMALGTEQRDGEVLSVRDVVLQVAERSVTRGGSAIAMTGLEFDILTALMRRAGRVVPRDALMAAAGRGDTLVSDRTVDVHVSHVRQKLGDDPRTPTLIKTVRGVGYVFAKDASDL